MAILRGNEQELFSLVLPMFGQMRPLRGVDGRYSALKTIEAYLAEPRTINRKVYRGAQLRQVLIDFYNMPRKWFASSNEFSYLTPVGLWAIKNKTGIGYNEWDKEDKAIKYLTGKVLSYSNEITRQSGLAAPGVREVDFMILDILDWDRVPDSIGEEAVW